MKSTRLDTIRALKAAGLHRAFALKEPDLAAMLTYFESLSGGSHPASASREMVRQVSRYLFSMDPQSCNVRFVTCRASITAYMEKLRRETPIHASSMINILTTICDASRFATHLKVPRIDSHRKIERRVSKLKGPLRPILLRRKRYVKNVILRRVTDGPDLQDMFQKLQGLIPHMRGLLSQGHGLSNEEANVCTSYLAGVTAIYNASRPGHVTRLTQAEFAEGTLLDDGHLLAICGSSKTGQAPVIFTPELLEMTRQYQRDVRIHFKNSTPGGSARLFLNVQGNELRNLSTERHLYKVFRMAGITSNTSLTDIRKCVTTKAAALFRDDPARRGLLNEFLCHSHEVASQYYEAAGRASDLRAGFDAVRATFLSS